MSSENIDAKLKQLAIIAQKYPPKTKERQRALAQLIAEIWRSKQLVRPYQGKFKGFYEDIYAEALQRLLLYCCENIERYNPNLEVLQWMNFLLKKRFFIEASRELMPTNNQNKSVKIKKVTIDILDRKNPLEITTKQSKSLSEALIECIREDRENLFKNTHIVNHRSANFQFIALKILSGYSWKEISETLGIKIPTLSSFYQRCLSKFAPKFKQYLKQ